MRYFAVIGNPIEHSRSPELHHSFAEKLSIPLQYNKILSSLEGFEDTVREFFKDGGAGLNVTVPFKEQAFKLCDVLTERAKIARSVNTLWYEDGVLYGDNTDGEGLVQALKYSKQELEGAKILILGAGGATRGVVYPLASAGVEKIVVANRTLSKAEQLVRDILPALGRMQLLASGLADISGTFDIVINATSATLSSENGLTLPENLNFKFAYEMAYGKRSNFLEYAKEKQIPYADGWSMLVGQAIEAFEIWHQQRPDIKDFLS